MASPEKGAQRGARGLPTATAPPDGGYGWFVLLANFMVFGLTFGVIKSFGVLYVEIHGYFETTATGTSWITSIAVATVHCAAPVASALSAGYGHRPVVVIGGLLSSVGMMGGAYARNLVELYVTVGFLTGLGYALTWTPTVTMLGCYFERRRPMANALASAGECVFTFLLTPLFQLLVHCYSWRGAMLVLGGLQLNLSVCGMLLRPLHPSPAKEHRRWEGRDEEEGGLEEECLDLSKTKCEGGGGDGLKDKQEEEGKGGGLQHGDAAHAGPTESHASEGGTRDATAEEVDTQPSARGGTAGGATDASRSTTRPLLHAHASARPGGRATLRTRVLRYVDYTLIADGRFMVYSMFGVFAALGFFAPALFLVPYARSRGVGEYHAAALMSIAAAMDLTGRVFFGWVANLRLVETVQQLTVTVILLGVVLLLCPLASTFPELAAFSAAYGLVFGATVSIHVTVLAEVVGVQRLGSALGFFMLIRSSGGLLGPPIAGFFIDKMSDYSTGFLMAGVSLIVSALFLLLLRQMNRGVRGSTAQGRDAVKGRSYDHDGTR